MRHIVVRAILAGCLTLATGLAGAAEYTLTISSWNSPQHGINAKMWPRFVEMIEEATDGRVTADLKIDLAAPTAQADVVQDGVADIAIIAQSYSPGRFPSARLAERPGYEASTEELSAAYWRGYDQYLRQANEYRGLKLLALHVNGPALLHSAKPVTQLSDISGMKLRITDEAMGRFINLLGATGINVPAPKVYETLSSNAADGVLMPMETRVGFRLTEVAQNVYLVPGGFGRFSFAFVMNEEAFADLPEDIRIALDEKVFGEPLSRELGRIWDEVDEIGHVGTLATPGNAINTITAEDQAEFSRQAEVITQALIAELNADGIDAAAVVDLLRNAAAGN